MWLYQFKIGARHRRVTLGSATAVTLTSARKTAGELHAKVRLGRDPAGEKAEGRVRAAETVGAVLASYLEQKRASLRPLSFVQVKRHLQKHCKPLHGLQLAKVDRRAVAARIAVIETKNGKIAANRTQSSLSAFFAWCMRQGLTDSNPVIGTDRRPEQSRVRVLTDNELKAIWNATSGADDYSAIVRLLMLTAARASEIGSLRWSEITDTSIMLPATRTKKAREHAIPLTDTALAIIAARQKYADQDFIFGRRNDRPFTGWSVCKAALDARLAASGMKAEWVHHDLRRSAATKMAELGIEPHIIEAVLNHVSGHKAGVAGVYNRAKYDAQKKIALQRWAEHVLAIVEGRASNVVPLRQA